MVETGFHHETNPDDERGDPFAARKEYKKRVQELNESLRTGQITKEEYKRLEKELNHELDPYGRIRS